MDREDVLALLDVLRLQTVYRPPTINAEEIARKFVAIVTDDHSGWTDQASDAE